MVVLLRSAMRALVILLLLVTSAYAQGSTKSALSGIVLDHDKAVVPGATVEVKDQRTGVTTTVVTNATGAFDAPALDAGVYTVTVSLAGFRTVILSDVELISGVPRALRVVLDVGGIQETVEVRGGSQLIQSQTTTVAATIRADQIESLPLVTRNTLNVAVFLPGVDTSSNNHNQRQSTIVGLP